MTGVAFPLALALSALAALAGAVLPHAIRRAAVGLGTAAAGVAGVIAGLAATAGQTFTATLSGALPLSGLRFDVDPLGGLFIAVIAAVAVAAGIYGISAGTARTRPSPTPRRPGEVAVIGIAGRTGQAVFPLLVAAMLLVPAAASVSAFLVCWELVTVASLLLVLTEHRQRPHATDGAVRYGVLAHLGFLTVLMGLLWFASAAADDSFGALREASGAMSEFPKGMVFLLSLVGFAAKAGIAPLSGWLPKAQPETPDQVSALLSAAMVTLGGYGILRVGFDLLGGGPRWWWLLVLGLGALSAVYGGVRATGANDLKVLLSHTTTLHMGLVLIGIGAAGLFAAMDNLVLAGLAVAAALLHTINHAATHTLLFLAAGSVRRGAGSADLNQLGGLRRRLPATTGLFGFGALVAAILPPGNVFVSVWLLLQSLVHGLPSTGAVTSITVPMAMAAIAAAAGLSVASFGKAFGLGFLARPRSPAAAGATESPPAMLAGTAIAALVCLGLAVLPTAVLPGLAGVAAVGPLGADPATSGALTVRLTGFAGSLSPVILAVALVIAIVAVAGLPRLLAGRRLRATKSWQGGVPATGGQRGAHAFTEPLPWAAPGRLPDQLQLRRPVAALASGITGAGRWLATGSVHRFLGYGCSAVIMVLFVLAVTR